MYTEAARTGVDLTKELNREVNKAKWANKVRQTDRQTNALPTDKQTDGHRVIEVLCRAWKDFVDSKGEYRRLEKSQIWDLFHSQFR